MGDCYAYDGGASEHYPVQQPLAVLLSSLISCYWGWCDYSRVTQLESEPSENGKKKRDLLKKDMKNLRILLRFLWERRGVFRNSQEFKFFVKIFSGDGKFDVTPPQIRGNFCDVFDCFPKKN